MLVKLDHFPKFRGENKKIFEVSPPSNPLSFNKLVQYHVLQLFLVLLQDFSQHFPKYFASRFPIIHHNIPRFPNYLVVEPTHLKKYATVKLDHFARDRGENKKYLETTTQLRFPYNSRFQFIWQNVWTVLFPKPHEPSTPVPVVPRTLLRCFQLNPRLRTKDDLSSPGFQVFVGFFHNKKSPDLYI